MSGQWLEGAVLVVVVPAWLGWRWLRTHLIGLCLWCGGTGKNPLSTRTRFGTCRHCGGSGRRTRRV